VATVRLSENILPKVYHIERRKAMHSLVNQINNIEIQMRDVLNEYALLKQALYETIERLQDVTEERDQLRLERDSLAEHVQSLMVAVLEEEEVA
jgi:hypothetical protein